VRILAATVGVLSLLGLLTWLLVRGISTDAPAYATTLRAFDDFALAEASLNRDVLQARAGLLGDYDTLANALEAMEDAVARLRSRIQTEGLDAGPIDRLTAAVALQEALAERFKSSNALLQNSLSYVGSISAGPAFAAQDARLASATNALAAAILHLMRDTSADAVKALGERIDGFATQTPAAGPDAEATQALLSHARLLHDLLPTVDETLKALVSMPGRRPLEEIRAQFAYRQSIAEATARRFQLLMYLVSLLLLVTLVRLGLRLRSRALALRRRAAFEHVIAENSTRLINSQPAETDARLKQVLEEICRAIGVERGYVVLDETPIRMITWCEEGVGWPLNWPDRALALSAGRGTIGSEIVIVPDVTAMPAGERKDVLTAAGARGWSCVPLIRPGRVRGILGFDTFSPAWDMVFPLPVVRLAGDAVANALEREFLEDDRARLTTRLERARRLQMIGSLASGIAHNFNNIIAAILGYSEMAESQLKPGTKSAQHVEEIRRAADRGRDLIDSILAFGRRDTRVRPVHVRTLLEEAASLLRASLPPIVDLIVEDVPAGLAISGEPAQLQQVILNLSNNAALAMDGGGSIRVSTELKDISAPLSVSHGELAPGRYVCLAVVDTGCGFDANVARRLFEPFFTTRLAGTGLGLATVQEIVRDHDGAMNVQSTPAFGSRFEVWLPATAAVITEKIEAESLRPGRGETVLLVEAEHERLLRDEEMLAALGYEPVGFAQLADALVARRAQPERFDIILVSHSEIEHGLESANALNEIAPRQPLLLATTSAIDVSVDALTKAGISEVLRRPLVGAELAAALARCVRAAGTLQR
jgi:signal transduction histidine kinase